MAQQATQQSHAKANDEVTAAKVYDSLSPEEQYRFECFRRCGFASKPIEKFVAKTLIEEAKKRYMARRGAMVGLGAEMSGGAGSLYDEEAPNNINSTIAAAVTDSSDGDSTKKLNSSRKRKKQSKKHILREESKRRRAAMDQPLPYFLGGGGSGNGSSSNGHGGSSIPPLDNLVVPDSASEIVAVVSTLAKCYGQRLVAAAKRVADAEEEEKKLNGTAGDATSSATKPLLPHHFLEAQRHRARAGVDPGFWMADRIKGKAFSRGGVGAAEAAALGTVDRDRACYLAALAAQDAYDREVEEGEETQQEKVEDSKMEVEEVGKDDT